MNDLLFDTLFGLNVMVDILIALQEMCYRVYKYRLPFSYPLLLNDVIEYFTKLNLVLILTHETII